MKNNYLHYHVYLYIILMNNHKVEFKYLCRYWNKPFDEIDGYYLIMDFKKVFGYNDIKAKEIITDWFKDYSLTCNWFEDKFIVGQIPTPSSQLFYFDYIYSNSESDVTINSGKIKQNKNNRIYDSLTNLFTNKKTLIQYLVNYLIRLKIGLYNII